MDSINYTTELGQNLASALYHSQSSVLLDGTKAIGTPEQVFKQHYEHPYSVEVTSAFINTLVSETFKDINKNYGYMSGFPYEPEMKKMAQGLVLLNQSDLAKALTVFETRMVKGFEDYAEDGKLKEYEKECLSAAIANSVPRHHTKSQEFTKAVAMWNIDHKVLPNEVAQNFMRSQSQFQDNYKNGASAYSQHFGRTFAAECAKITVNNFVADGVSIKESTEHFIKAIAPLNDSDFAYGMNELKNGVIDKVPALTNNGTAQVSFTLVECVGEAVRLLEDSKQKIAVDMLISAEPARKLRM